MKGKAKSSVRGWLLFATAQSLLLLTGCVPGVAWLPDSSGFVYTAGKDYQQLVHFDVAKKQRRILVEDTKAPTFWPAVSPDGQQIAVAQLAGAEAKNLQIVRYDRAAKELHRSKAFAWVAAKGKDSLETREDKPQLFWAPRGDKIVVHVHMRTGIYDVKADSMQQLDRESLLLVFGGTPIRPDGGGFILIRENGMKDTVPSTFRFVDWKGKETPIAAPPLLKDKAAIEKEKDINKLVALLCPAVYQSQWEGNIAKVSWNIDLLRYDTVKNVAVIDKNEPEKAADGQIVKQKFAFADTKVQVRTVTLPEKEKKETDIPKVRIEILKAGANPQVVLEESEMCVFAPAPNRKLLAIRCLIESPRKQNGRDPDERILVINQTGEVVAHLHVSK
jgi:hypothetical protein